MTETIKYSRIGEQDLALQSAAGDTTFTVTLPDGRQVTLDKISLDSFTAYGDVDFNLQEANSLLLEILTSNPSTNTQGRIFLFDTTDDVVRYMDGSNVRTLVDLTIAQTLTNKTLTQPVIAQIDDSNGNELLQLTLAASAVNYFDITNSTNNSDLIIRAEGDDTDIDIDIQSKGGGSVLVNGSAIASFPVASTGQITQYDGSSWVAISGIRIDIVAPATPIANTLYQDTFIKGWMETSGAGSWTVDDEVNVSSIDDNAAGNFTINWVTAFASANYAVVANTIGTADSAAFESTGQTKTTALVRIITSNQAGTATDPGTGVSVMAIGNQ